MTLALTRGPAGAWHRLALHAIADVAQGDKTGSELLEGGDAKQLGQLSVNRHDCGENGIGSLMAAIGEGDVHAAAIIRVCRPREVTAQHEAIDQLARRLLGDAELLDDCA